MMDMLNHYERISKNFLGVCNISLSWKYIHNKKQHNVYEVILHKHTSLECFIFTFTDSISRTTHNINSISIYIILSCLTTYNPGSFKDFVDEYGVKNKDWYKRVKNEWYGVIKFFTPNQLQLLNNMY